MKFLHFSLLVLLTKAVSATPVPSFENNFKRTSTIETRFGSVEIIHEISFPITKRINGGVNDNHKLDDGDQYNTPVTYSDTQGVCPFPSDTIFQETAGGAGLEVDMLINAAGGMQPNQRYTGTQQWVAGGETYQGEIDIQVQNYLTVTEAYDVVNLANEVAADIYDSTNGQGFNTVTLRGTAFGGGFIVTWLFYLIGNGPCG